MKKVFLVLNIMITIILNIVIATIIIGTVYLEFNEYFNNQEKKITVVDKYIKKKRR